MAFQINLPDNANLEEMAKKMISAAGLQHIPDKRSNERSHGTDASLVEIETVSLEYDVDCCDIVITVEYLADHGKRATLHGSFEWHGLCPDEESRVPYYGDGS